MSKQRVDHDYVTIRIENIIDCLPPTHSERRIFRVHDQVRKKKEEAYEPTTVAIGPYHHGKNNLKAMEEHKYRYLQQVRQENNELSLNLCVMAMRDLEERARKCYVKDFDDRKFNIEFVEMMLLDGFFIIQFFRNIRYRIQGMGDIDPNDHIFRSAESGIRIICDLMLVENQLPFFILDRLFNMTTFPHENCDMKDLAIHCLGFMFPSHARATVPREDNVDHLLSLMHKFWSHSYAMCRQYPEGRSILGFKFIKCTTELLEAGVKLKESSQTTISLLDIKFEGGVLKIPQLSIYDGTEYVFRNLIAYKQDFPRNSPKYITDYALFMDRLINSAKDVEILRNKGIILNGLGDDEAVSTMFNKLCTHATLSNNFSYAETFERLNTHCKKRRNIWCANLRRNYFSSPWSIISLTGAILLLLLTLTQTIFSIPSHGG